MSRLFVELVTTALDAARRTAGAVDPTVGAHLTAAGYDRDIRRLRELNESATAVGPTPGRQPDWRAVRVDRDLGLVGLPSGLALDLGATAKAWAADRAARELNDRLDRPVLVEIGGDVAVAGATESPFAITVAESAGAAGETVALSRGGVATSTTTLRRWRQASGDPAHHIIDPSTGVPAVGPWRTASVWGTSAVAANTASTAAIVMGESAVPWLTDQAPAARLVGVDGRVRRLTAWPTEVEAAR